MKRPVLAIAILAALGAAGFGGYQLGRDRLIAPSAVTTAAQAQAADRVIYYQDPDRKPFYSANPKTTADGRPYRAVHASEDINFDEAPGPTREANGSRKILYYRNPMGLADVSKVPKKDPMGMDYIPVYEGDEADGKSVKLSPGRLQRIGVKSEPAALRTLSEPVRAPGIIQSDERRVSVVSLRAESFIESVEDVTTGSEVRKGQPLFQLYSPAITLAGAEYLTSFGLKAAGRRLLNYGVPQEFLAEIDRTKQVPLTLTWTAPSDGVVVERNIVPGMRAMPGDVLLRISDHSVVWALVDVAERDLSAVSAGEPALIRVRSYPNRTFSGKVALVYPELNAATRTVRVRIELANHDMLLKPDMYAEAEIDTGGGTPVLTVPDNSVINNGDRQIVIIDRGEGRFEPRAVHIGRSGAGYTEVRDGIKEGDAVVTSANFLIDAESNLKSALNSLAAGGATP